MGGFSMGRPRYKEYEYFFSPPIKVYVSCGFQASDIFQSPSMQELLEREKKGQPLGWYRSLQVKIILLSLILGCIVTTDYVAAF